MCPGLTPLMAAAGAGPTNRGDELARLRLILGAGADVHAVDDEGRTALAFACGRATDLPLPSDDQLRADLVAPPPSPPRLRPNQRGNHIGFGSLEPRRPVPWGGAGRVSALIEAGANVNDPLLLTHVIWSTDDERFRVLLAAGADPLASTPDGATPLYAAAGGGTATMLATLIEQGADVNAAATLRECSYTPLLVACSSFQDAAEKVRLLLAAGADPDAGHRPPLLEALQYGDGEAAALLIRHGARLDAASNDGASLFPFAALHADGAGFHAVMKAG